jgi:hypothetical protein
LLCRAFAHRRDIQVGLFHDALRRFGQVGSDSYARRSEQKEEGRFHGVRYRIC